jgi:hypothetical protein
MKTISVTVERNFHIMNDDRFIMEKISHTVELEESDNTQFAMEFARHEIETNFRGAYPHIEEHLNFHVVRQVNKYEAASNDRRLEALGIKPAIPSFEEIEEEFKAEKINKYNGLGKDAQKPIDTSYNVIEEINKCKSSTLLKIYKLQCKTPEEHKAYEDKAKEFKVKAK